MINTNLFTTTGQALLNSLQVTGQTQTGSLLVTDNSQLANLTADSISTNYLFATGQILAGSINSGQYLINGNPLLASPWTISGSDIYFGGKVGINTSSPPSFALEVDGNGVFSGKVIGQSLAVQDAISIGNFRFVNGALISGRDTIRTDAELVMTARRLSLLADTVQAKERIEAKTIEAEQVKAGEVRADTVVRVAGGGIVIDGIASRITSGSGTISFNDENLITTGSIASQDLYVQRAINIGDFEFKNGATLPGQKDTIKSTVGIVLESAAEMITLSSDSVVAKEVIKAKIVKADTLKTETLETEKEIRVKGMVIDGVNSRIISNSGSINFDDENLITTGSIGGRNLYVQNSVNIGDFKFINGAVLPGQKDTISSPAEIVVSSEAEKILLESDTVTAKNVLEAQTLKTTTLSAETIESDSAIKVAGNGLVIDGINNRITSASGTISFDDEDLVTTGTATTNRLVTSRIFSPDGTVHFGDSTLNVATDGTNRISWNTDPLIVSGIRIGNGAGADKAMAMHSMALGHNVGAMIGADNSVVIGSGISDSWLLTAQELNSLIVGFNSNVPTLFVGGGDGTSGSLGNVGIGTGYNLPTARLHVNGDFRLTDALYDSNNQPGSSGQVLMTTGNSVEWANASTLDGGNWTRPGGNIMHTAHSDDKVGIGTSNPNATLTIYESSETIPILSIISDRCTLTQPGSPCETGNIFEIKKPLSPGVFSYPLVVKDTGSVGIGMNTPLDRLDINGALRIRSSSSSPTISNATNHLRLGSSFNISGLNYYSWIQSYTTNNELVLNPVGGNVGIGTNNPQKKLQVNGPLRVDDGFGHGRYAVFEHESTLNYYFNIRTNIGGIYFSPIGITKMCLTDTGRVGIGTINPQRKLDVRGRAVFEGSIALGTGIHSVTLNPYLTLQIRTSGNDNPTISLDSDQGNDADFAYYQNNVLTSLIRMSKDADGATWDFQDRLLGIDSRLFIDGNGNVGIGTTSPNATLHVNGKMIIGSDGIMDGYSHDDYNLAVKGKIVAYEMHATMTGWGDFVFDEDYKLCDLYKVEKYIKNFKHLSGVPSEKEVLKNGINMGEMLSIQQVKIEELTLYTINQQKQIDELSKALKIQIKEINKLKSELLESQSQ
ncbi:MAG: hypothetical protein ABII90_07745 [Bacteroidota bacterium]